MCHSDTGFLTTHTGSLPRNPDLAPDLAMERHDTWHDKLAALSEGARTASGWVFRCR